jgi:predicted Rossmann fold nucleotide-binding protein DprA/Smf involved in DNA uptake
MPKAITVSGARVTNRGFAAINDELFAQYLAPFAAEHTQFYVGGAVGIDSLALRWLAKKSRAIITVAVPATVADQPDEAQREILAASRLGRLSEVIELRHPRFPEAQAYHARNRWMVDHSDFVIAFPQGTNGESGTWQTIQYAAALAKPRLIVPL